MKISLRTLLRTLLSTSLAMLALPMVAIGPARPQSIVADPVDVDAAKREGKVSWYTSTPVALAQTIANAFDKEYGIRVQIFRSGGSAVLRRFQQEFDAGRVAADVLTMSDASAANELGRKGVFVPFKPEGFDKVIPAGKDPAGLFVANRMTLVGMMARTDKVAASDLPTTWNDLRLPKYKGKLIMPDPSFTSIQLLAVGTLSRKLGWSYYEDLRKNDTMIVQGHQQMFDMLKRGERLIAAEGGDPYAFTEGGDPGPVTAIYAADASIFLPSPTGVIKGGPNPNAAKLFAQFNLRPEIQQLFPPQGMYSARADVKGPPNAPALETLTLLPVDYDDIEQNAVQIKTKFNDIFQ